MSETGNLVDELDKLTVAKSVEKIVGPEQKPDNSVAKDKPKNISQLPIGKLDQLIEAWAEAKKQNLKSEAYKKLEAFLSQNIMTQNNVISEATVAVPSKPMPQPKVKTKINKKTILAIVMFSGAGVAAVFLFHLLGFF